ncbi:MAG: VacJ family lipoprotein [Burkholderiaceae bacterium]|nr:VacJ family lipoprotein [Burkholderiaceae bacterium]
MSHSTANLPLRAGILVLAILLGGCATGPNANPRDPFEPFNRGISRFNEDVDRMVLKPVATAYKQITPSPVRTGVSNFFANLGDVWSAVNSALQLKFGNAAENILRFNVNTFFGLGGLIDIASDANIERHKEDFGQTLGRWGVPSGPYLVLPLLGPSTVRDAAALTVDVQGRMLSRVDPDSVRHGLYVLEAVEKRANVLRSGAVLDEAALDKYSFTRDAYLQYRRASISDDAEGRAIPGDANPGDGRLPEVEPEPTSGAAPSLVEPPAQAAPPAASQTSSAQAVQ